MRTTHFWLLAGLLIAAGCGDATDPSGGVAAGEALQHNVPLTQKTVPAEIGRLVPKDARILLIAGSLDRLQGKLKPLVRALEIPMPSDPGLALGFATGLPAHRIDRTKPFAVAGSVGEDGPEWVFIVPEREEGTNKEGVVRAGGYLGIASKGSATLQEEAPALAQGIMDADVSVRIDLAGLVQTFRPQLEEAFDRRLGTGEEEADAPGEPAEEDPEALEYDELEGMDDMEGLAMLGTVFQGVAGELKTWAFKIVDSAETLDLGISLNEGQIEIGAAFTAKKGSPLDRSGQERGSLTDLARYLPASSQVTLMFRADLSKFWSFYGRLMSDLLEYLEPEERQELQRLMKEGEALFEAMGDRFAAGATLSQRGMEMAGVYTARDPKVLLEKSLKLMDAEVYKDMLGVEVKEQEATKLAGIDVRRFAMTFDWKKLMEGARGDPSKGMDALFGGDTIQLWMGVQEDKLIWAAGSEAYAKEVFGGNPPRTAIDAAARKTGDLGLLVHVDLRGLLRGMRQIAVKAGEGEEFPAVPAGKPLPISVFGGSEGRVHRLGLSFNVVDIYNTFKPLTRTEVERVR